MKDRCITHAQEKVCQKRCDCDTNNKPMLIEVKLDKIKTYWLDYDAWTTQTSWMERLRKNYKYKR